MSSKKWELKRPLAVCRLHAARSTYVEEQALSRPPRIKLSADFQAYLTFIAIPIKYALNAALKIRHGDLHLGHVALGTFEYTPTEPRTNLAKQFRLQDMVIKTHRAFKSHMSFDQIASGSDARLFEQPCCFVAEKSADRCTA